MKKLITMALAGVSIVASAATPNSLRFNPNEYTVKSLKMVDGTEVKFKAYEGIYYVTNVEDSTYQTLNFYVPEQLANGNQTPILLRTYVGGYMAATAKTPSATDATGRALQEGYAVCIPGSRGSNSVVTDGKKEVYTGIAPNGLLDLKAAIRYLHFNDDVMAGSAERIFTDGTSAGGAMSSLMGATGNSKRYEAYLQKMGAAEASDAVFASICYCPITDLNHADMEYEWLYSCTNDSVRHLSEAQKTVSAELAALCPDYINSLNLTTPDGEKLTADKYKNYLKKLLIESAHKALQAGVEIPDSIGVILYQGSMGGFPGGGPRGGMRGGLPGGQHNGQRPPMMMGDGRGAPSFGPAGARPMFHNRTDFVADIDLDKYLNYVASSTALKNPPAFDSWGVLDGAASAENKVFGNSKGEPANFTEYSLRAHDGKKATLGKEIQERVYIMNPMNFIGGESDSQPAKHWYIRHGAKDRDTSFLVPVNLALKLQNAGYDVNLALPWNRPHSGDYNLDDLFAWIQSVVK
jgi:hypothetical protein